jgi:hypothetical protein
MDNSIGDFLSDEPTGEATTEAVEAVVEQPEAAVESEPETAERPRGPDGKFIAREAGVEEVAPPATDRLPQAEYAALKDERTKRQQLEERLRQYDDYFAQVQAQQQPQQRIEKPDMFADPEGYEAHLRSEILAQVKQELQPTIQQSQIMGRAEVSELMARQKYEDYDATIEQFKEALTANPFLLNQIQQAPDPATFAYNAGKQWEASKSYGHGAPPSEEQVEARMREKIIAELGLDRPKAPSTFAGDRSVGSRAGPAWTGPTPMGDLLT